MSKIKGLFPLILLLAILGMGAQAKKKCTGKGPINTSDTNGVPSSATQCDPNNRPQWCTDDYTPVCAHIAGCTEGACSRTIFNGCEACAAEDIDYHTPGECPVVRTHCDANNRPQWCTDDYIPVCAHIAGCTEGACTRTIFNGCEACAAEDIDYHVPGECRMVRTQCDPNNRPQWCTDDWNPVCARLSECTYDGVCFQTASNACEGCALANAEYHTPGECSPDLTQGADPVSQQGPISDEIQKLYCDPNDRPQWCTDDYTPVCAHIAGCTEEACTRTIFNACEACAAEDIDYHTSGECPVVQTQCDPNNRPQWCTDDYTPVCAHIAGCTEGSCTRTIFNGCTACSDETVDYHVPGECPYSSEGKEPDEEDILRTICDPNNRPQWCTDDWTPVCAYLSECNADGICVQTASNACEGCAIATAMYHIPGECQNQL